MCLTDGLVLAGHAGGVAVGVLHMRRRLRVRHHHLCVICRRRGAAVGSIREQDFLGRCRARDRLHEQTRTIHGNHCKIDGYTNPTSIALESLVVYTKGPRQ